MTAERAREGDTDSALDILRDFADAIDQYNERTWSGPIHWDFARYIADAFKKVVRSEMRSPRWHGPKWPDAKTGEAQRDANLALGIKTSKAGRRKGIRTHDGEALAAAYWYLCRRGFGAEAAVAALSAQTGADRRTIQRASSTPGNLAFQHPKLIDEKSLEAVFSRRYAADITAILAAGSTR